MAIPAYYQKNMARALPGQVSDTSAYNIDAACVLETPDGLPIFVGVAVSHGGVDAMGNKLIKPLAAGRTAYGVAIRSHFQTTSSDGRMVYENAGGINVMTEGRVWMLADNAQSAVAYDTPIKVKQDGGAVDTENGEIETDWVATGDFTTFHDLKLIEVKLFGA